MELPRDLVKEFAQVTVEDDAKPNESTVPGTTVSYEGQIYVKLDGSDQLTPISTTTTVGPNQRVNVLIKNHTATVTGNYTDPSASSNKVNQIGDQISEFEIVIADKVDTDELNAQIARIDQLVSDNITVNGKIDAAEAEIDDLTAQNATITGNLEAANAEIENLKATKIDADIVEAKYATIENLEATNADIHNLQADYGEFKNLTTDNLNAQNAAIENLKTTKLDAESADIRYAKIDFANIGEAAIENLFSKSGIIGDLVMSDGHVTGTLVGVTIKGDLIEGNTIVADKLVIQGEDGLYYKLNTNGETITSAQTEYNSLNGSVITAKSITAEKVAVDDLVAFGATIGGFHITEDSLYSGVKASVDNTTPGTYMNSDGEFVIGDSNNYLKFFKDTTDSTWKLQISANSIKFGASGTSLDDLSVGGRNYFVMSRSKSSSLNGIYCDIDGYDIHLHGTNTHTSEAFNVGASIPFSGELLNNIGSTMTLSVTNRPNEDYYVQINYVPVGESISQSLVSLHGHKGTSLQFTMPEPSNIYAFIGISKGVETIDVTFRVKIERGTIATDWSPAPEDIATSSALDSVNQTATTANSNATAAQTTAEAANDKINNLQVGGRNLLLNSGFVSSFDPITLSKNKYGLYSRGGIYKVTRDESTMREDKPSLKIVGSEAGNSSGKDICWGIVPVANSLQIGTLTGKPIVFSFWAKAQEGSPKLNARLGYETYVSSKAVTLTTSWQRYVIQIADPATAKADREIIFYLDAACTVWLSECKAEFGNKPTDWSPAPEDMATTSELDSVNQTATNANSNATAAQIAADAANDKINNLQVGGRNLAEGTASYDTVTQYNSTLVITTGTDDTVPSHQYLSATNESGNNSFYFSNTQMGLPESKMIDGEDIVVSFWIKCSKDLKDVRYTFKYEAIDDEDYYRPVVSTSWTKGWIKGKANSNNPYKALAIYNATNLGAATVYISSIKIEKGNKPTDWTPAPEDMASSEDITAAKEEIISQTNASLEVTQSNIISKVETEYYSKGDIDSQIGSISTAIEQTSHDLTINFNQLSQDLTDIHNETNNQFDKLNKYIRFVDGNIIIGVEGNQLTLRISNDRISFLESENEVAYMSNNKLYIQDGEIIDRFMIGRFAFYPRDNGNMTLRYM